MAVHKHSYASLSRSQQGGPHRRKTLNPQPWIDIIAPQNNSLSGSLVFIETEFGKPHSTKGLGNWFANQCILADIPGRAHGLRKAGATIAAENGATPYQLMSIFGWKTLSKRSFTRKRSASSSWQEAPCT